MANGQAQKEFAADGLKWLLCLDDLSYEYNSNAPKDSIGKVFIPWYNFSAFQAWEEKVSAAEMAFKYDKNAWEHIYKMLPGNRGGIIGELHAPKYRDHAIDIDSQIELTASVYPANATFSEISWESSNPEVISVSGENFKINNTGDVVLTAKSHDGVESSIELTVVSEAMIIEICIGVGAVCLIIVGVIVVLKKKSRRIN